MIARASTTSNFQVIGLTGPKGSGKDTAAALLATHAHFYPIAFADALRSELADAFQVDASIFVHRETKETPLRALALERCLGDNFVARMIVDHEKRGESCDLSAHRSPRQILTWWGTDFRRVSDERYWLRPVIQRVTELRRSGIAHRFVLTDVRYGNEAGLVREYGGLLWQITRPGCGVPAGSHSSETTGAAFAPDTVINNMHDVRHLQQQVLGAWCGVDLGLQGAVRLEISQPTAATHQAGGQP